MHQEPGPDSEPSKMENDTVPRETVLVVDDDDALRSALRETLSEEGFRVGCVENGRQAIDVLKAAGWPDDLILKYDDSLTPYTEVRLKRADAALAESIIAAYYTSVAYMDERPSSGRVVNPIWLLTITCTVPPVL